jgi:hypothetical protein
VSAALCSVPYLRPDETTVRCTYLKDHPNERHSWWAVQCQDEVDAETAAIDYTPTAVQALLDAITRGEVDPYIEAILAVGHNRKRALRNVIGFGHIQIAPRIGDTPR